MLPGLVLLWLGSAGAGNVEVAGDEPPAVKVPAVPRVEGMVIPGGLRDVVAGVGVDVVLCYPPDRYPPDRLTP